MEISWINVIAQIVNFLILIWLLQRILYKPIIGAIDERREKIEQQQAEAKNKQQAADDEALKYTAMQKDLDRKRDVLMAEARSNAEDTYKKLIKEMRNKVLSQKNEWLEGVAAEQQAFLEAVRSNTIEVFSRMAQKTFKDLSSQTLEQQIAIQFIHKLRDLSNEEIVPFKKVENGNSRQANISSTYALSKQIKHDITQAIHEKINKELVVRYEETDRIVCGIEMRIGGFVVRWSLDGYLEDMNADLKQELEHTLMQVNKAAAE